ncbi:hypothetical protein [Planctomycetes bacterium K23_9]|uniref:Uncharacterized protein n=1 Tax=Stieleria marina TaxID=1930275 RepID=A0A517P3E2_9BACT|nr:hypothetical protein K239x_59120 [Planctomycetes bacterium K23_9]
MKRRNAIACDEARLILASGDRPIDHLDSDTLDRHLENVYLFKLGLYNSFGVEFRSQSYTAKASIGQTTPVLFNYLSEVLPLVQTQADRLPVRRLAAYNSLADAAINSFWEIFYRFQPLIHQAANANGVEVDSLGNVLGRAILLYDKRRGFKFYSYLDKTLRESVKNLRGQVCAQQYQLPQSAGRLLPLLWWIVDQETLRLGHRLSADESDALVLDFLQKHPARFSHRTMQKVADVVRTGTRTLSLDAGLTDPFDSESQAKKVRVPTQTDSDSLESQDEYEHTLRRIADATQRAQFTKREQAILLQRLELAYDQNVYADAESELTAGSLRNRRAQLLVRFLAAFHCPDARRFGKFLLADPVACKPFLARAIDSLAAQFSVSTNQVIRCVLNDLALSETPYRVSITQRGQLEAYLRAHPHAPMTAISGHLFHKLKAGLIDQDRLDFPCIRKLLSD